MPAFEAEAAPDWYQCKLTSLEAEGVVVPPSFSFATSERIAAQQGRFTMCFKILQEHDCIISQIVGAGKSEEDIPIRKLVIPAGSVIAKLVRERAGELVKLAEELES